MKPIEISLTKLVKEQPWFAALALRLRLREDPTLPTLATDGRELIYNEQYFKTLSPPLQLSAVMHETLHCAMRHFSKDEIGARDLERSNQAQDYAINGELKECGFPLHEGWLQEDRFHGMTWQAIYNILEREEQEGKRPKPKKCGCVKVAEGSKGDQEKLASDWAKAVVQASAVTDKHSKIPASLRRAIDAIQTKNNWRDTVARYLTKLGDVAWTRPNKRLVGQGLYLPGSIIDSLGTLVIAVDTSGSISPRMLSCFAGEANGILDCAGWPERVVVIYCDAQVNVVEEAQGQITLEPHGGGGTAFQPVFDYCEQEGIVPDVLFYLTDLYGPMPEQPGYPVVWVTPLESSQEGPFGETIRIDVNAD